MQLSELKRTVGLLSRWAAELCTMKKLICGVVFCIVILAACKSSITEKTISNEAKKENQSTQLTNQLPATTQTVGDFDFVELIGTHWILKYLDDQELIPDTLITMQVTASDFYGTAGCNEYRVEYIAKEANCFMIGSSTINVEGCKAPEGIMEQEKEYMELLRSSVKYHKFGTELFLIDSQGKAVLRYQPQ
jgi:heat shock protein HslJ